MLQNESIKRFSKQVDYGLSLLKSSETLFTKIKKDLENLYDKVKKEEIKGEAADYIQSLKKADKNTWIVAIHTVDNEKEKFGTIKEKFTLQSCVKPIIYSNVVNEEGSEKVHKYVGYEASGRKYNDPELDTRGVTPKPFNAMVNTGAIVMTSLIKPGSTLADKSCHIKTFIEQLTSNGYVEDDFETYNSEMENGHKNRSLAHNMFEEKCFPDGTHLEETLDLYFQCCSIKSDCVSLATLAAVLANGGVCPESKEIKLKRETVQKTLSQMRTAGLYQYSGEFESKVGFPAKSGVSGVMMIVIPKKMGICCYSPPLDDNGSSERGIKFCLGLKEIFDKIEDNDERIDEAGQQQNFDQSQQCQGGC